MKSRANAPAMDEALEMRIGTVIENADKQEGGRIKAKVNGIDNSTPNDKLPYAFPLMPKMLHVMPKKDEAVLVFLDDKKQRWYIGPIISQPQFMDKDYYSMNATSMLNNGDGTPATPPGEKAETHGAYPKDEEIAICGRKESDIILSDNDVRIRCGAKKTVEGVKDPIFNKTDPAFVKLKYYDMPTEGGYSSAAAVVADEVLLVSHRSTDPVFTPSSSAKGDMISDTDMATLVEQCHVLPYGDILIDFLKKFVTAFQTHTHPYTGLPPCKDDTYTAVSSYDLNSMISEHVKIN